MADIDELLKGSFDRLAEPANSAGVADAIRSRVAAGDAGTSVAGSVAPGWGGGASGFLTIAAPIALIVVAGVVGGSLGASGVFGASGSSSGGEVPSYVIAPDTAPIYSCPGGPQIGSIPANTRVLAVARDEDAAFLGARNPDDLAATIWFTAGDLVLDDSGPAIDALPVESCPEVTVTEVTPTPTPEPTVEPEETDEPEPPSDTTPPSIKVGNWNPDSLVGIEFGYCSNVAQISVNAADNVGIASVTASSSRPSSPVTLVSSGGGTWVFKITGGSYTSATPTNITVTFTATDTSGLTASGSRVIPIYRDCLI